MFQNAPIDSAQFYFAQFYYEYREAFNEKVATDDRAMDYLNELQTQSFNFPDYLYLVYNFHGWLNGKKYSLTECKEIYERATKLQDVHYEKIEAKAQQIVQNNLTCCEIGDTLELIFPSGKSPYRPNIKEAILRPYPYSKEIFPFEDTIKLQALLQEKQLDTKDIVFRLYIIKLNEKKIMLLGVEYSLGDTMDLPIATYIRPITNSAR
ncbi:MAG: hypothetical protein KDJ52_35015 [Anaerolineae bacterium]|nr:hypothetical protein [Anaerolineae bacterium]